MNRYNTGYSSNKQREDNKEMIEFGLLLETQTENAILVVDENSDDRQVWLPKSQIEILHEDTIGIRFNCPRWLAECRKLI